MNPFVTFLIPSEGRTCLANALGSLYEQTDPDWNACVIFDGVAPIIQSRNKVHVMATSEKYGKGNKGTFTVRDYGLTYMMDKDVGGYIGFLDDDDTLHPHYVERLLSESWRHDEDVIIFKMQFADGGIMPPPGKSMPDIENAVGISFAVKTEICQHGFHVPPDTGEDYQYLKSLYNDGRSFYISEYINYFVNPIHCPKPDRVGLPR